MAVLDSPSFFSVTVWSGVRASGSGWETHYVNAYTLTKIEEQTRAHPCVSLEALEEELLFIFGLLLVTVERPSECLVVAGRHSYRHKH